MPRLEYTPPRRDPTKDRVAPKVQPGQEARSVFAPLSKLLGAIDYGISKAPKGTTTKVMKGTPNPRRAK